jgi:DNA polymerase I-like protein with 3'-5' exonuclease and polymerase domains
MRVFSDYPFLAFGVSRIISESRFPEIRRLSREFTIGSSTSLGETLAALTNLKTASELSVDIETCGGQITCIGFAPSPTQALCVPTLPKDYSETDFYELWNAIRIILENPARKILQNGIYDLLYLSLYGIKVRNFFLGGTDTMLLQKFLFPELPKGLDTIARLYTTEPYWKDDAKDWSARTDPDQLYRYNCLDTTGTHEACQGQKVDLAKKGVFQEAFFHDYIMKLGLIAFEMSSRGLCVDLKERDRLREEALKEIAALNETLQDHSKQVLHHETNPKSPKQVKELLAKCGMRIPFKHGKPSSDRESLMKLRLKHPESKVLTPLIQLSEKNKAFDSYLNAELEPDGKLRSTVQACSTESGRWAAYKNPFYRGLNIQTIPKKLKSQFTASKGHRLLEIDLAQADARVVAWLAPEPTMIRFFKEGIDIHRYVASRPSMFNCDPKKLSYEQRQLGKKVGHGANYGMTAPTLVSQCLREMDLEITLNDARKALEGRHRTFPGIPQWHRKIQRELSINKKLSTPLGRERTFYGRLEDSTFREAYAYIPSSTVTDVISLLAVRLFGRTRLLDQIHDSVLIEHPEEKTGEILEIIKDQDSWNPRLKLPGGEMRIPIEISLGSRWSELEEVYCG